MHNISHIYKNIKENELFIYFAALISCYLILLIKAWYITDTGDLLWIEDGGIFLNLANQFGAQSLLAPYAGYSVLITRLSAWIASFFNYSWQPLVLLICTLSLYALYLFIIYITLLSQNIRKNLIYFSLILLFLLPTNRELILTITNSQWFGGAAFIIYAVAYKKENNFFYNTFIAVLFGLTGPFVIFVIPILLIKYVLLKQKQNKKFYIICSIICIIQIVNILSSKRANKILDYQAIPDAIDYSFASIVNTLEIILFGYLYNPTNITILICIIIIMSIILYYLLINLNSSNKVLSLFFMTISFALLSAFALMVLKEPVWQYLTLMRDVTDSSRYLFIPRYLLLISGIILVNNSQLLSYTLISCFLIISISGFSFLENDKVHFQSFVNFSQYQYVSAVTNPIKLGFFPKSLWFVYLHRDNYKALPKKRIKNLGEEDITSKQAQLVKQDRDLHIIYGDTWANRYADLEFSTPIDCPDTKDIGLTFQAASSVPVRIEFSIFPLEKSEPFSSISLYQPLYLDTKYMALPFIKDGTKARMRLRFVPFPYPIYMQFDKVETTIKDLTLYCLPPM